ncbi:hypothetical protein PYCC9005_003070 [Savitreella phatthalungensis]
MSAVSWRRLAKQYAAACCDELEDIAVLPSTGEAGGSLSEIEAVIFGPAGTPYAGGAFRMRLVYGDDYPTAPPKGYFLTKLFHPNVSSKGDICVNTLKRDWTADVSISHILLVIKCLLIEPGPDSALNDEAGRLLLEDYGAFEKHARMYTDIHALTIDQGLALLAEDRRVIQKLSSATEPAAVLTQSSGNVRLRESDHAEQSSKKSKATSEEKVLAAKLKKAADARRKALKRL